MRARFDDCLEQAQAAFTRADLDHSLELFGYAEDLAREIGDVDLVDRAFCQRCFVLVEMGKVGDQVVRLKELFLRSGDQRNRWAAAYNIAVAYDVDEELEDAQQWASRATDLATDLNDSRLEARCNNLSGALALRTSHFEDAEACFRAILNADPSAVHVEAENAAQVLENLGYTLMCTDRLTQGIELCERACSELEEVGATHLLHEAMQDLCYGHLLADNLDSAQECGGRALDLALEADDGLVVKNSLFLLSEIAVRRGDTFGARRYLHDLTAYYPEAGVSEEIIDVFLATDLTTVVNLRG